MPFAASWSVYNYGMSVDVHRPPCPAFREPCRPLIFMSAHILSLDRRLQAYLASFLQLEDLMHLGYAAACPLAHSFASASCRSFDSLLSTHFTMARVCSAQRQLGFRCRQMGYSLSLLHSLLGENPLFGNLSCILNDTLEIATCHLTLTSRTIHTPTNPYLSTSDFFPNFPLLASILSRELCASTKVLTSVTTNTQLLDNLEIIALSLRRQQEQLHKVAYFIQLS